MNYKVGSWLEYNVIPKDFKIYYYIRNFAELKAYAQNCRFDYYNVYVTCKVSDGISPERITDELFFHVAVKLLYPNDIRKILKDNYGNVLDFERRCADDNVPMWFDGVRQESIPMIDESGRPYSRFEYRFCGWHLNQKDIVTDKNLHQIWPVKTNEYPTRLVELLNKSNEKIK